MSWRNQGITGSNNIPLGKMRRFGGDEEDGQGGATASPSADSYSNGDRLERVDRADRDVKRGRSPESKFICKSPFDVFTLTRVVVGSEQDGPKRRKKRNRWGDATENKAAGLMGLPTAIVANMTSEQLEAYTLHLRIEEITQKLKIDDVVPADGDRYVVPPQTQSIFPSCSNTLSTDRLLPHPSTTTMVVVSTPENTVTARSSRTSATS